MVSALASATGTNLQDKILIQKQNLDDAVGLALFIKAILTGHFNL